MEAKKIKKICFFSPASYPFFFPESDVAHGGAELQMYFLAKASAEYPEFDINFLVGNYGQKKKITQNNIRLIRTIRLLKKETIFKKLLKSFKIFFQLIKLKPDVLITTNASSLIGIFAFYTKIFGKKFIYRTSSLIDVNKDYIKQNGFTGKLYKYGLENANIVITQNSEHQKLLKQNHSKDAEIIKNVIEIKEYQASEKNFILWVSRYNKMKNPELFLRIAENFPDEKFVMICPYVSPDKKNWEQLKKSAEKIENLKFIEKVPFPEIQEYFNKAKLFVNTSDFEGFPNTFLQAALGKTPLISLNVNPDNFITEYNCGIFANGNFETLIKQTENLLQNETEQKIKAENLFRYLKENHDIKKVEQKFKTVIENTL